MIFLAKLGLGFAGTVVVGGAALCSQGFIQVRVHEKHSGGTNVSLIVPAALAPLTLQFAPGQQLAPAAAELRPYLPALDAAIPALEDCPDGVLVEVIDTNDHVRIAKRGGSIVVDVRDPEEDVHVSVPLRAAQSSIHEIAKASGVL